jgi:hypothetical protein
LDVTGYARLWRLTWWTQHVAWPLATFGAGAILLVFVWQASGQLDGWEKFMNDAVSLQPIEAEREFQLAYVAALFRLARDGLGPGLPWVAIFTAACLFEVLVYLRGRARFRLPLLSWSLVGLTVTAALALLGVVYADRLTPEGEQPAALQADAQALYYLALGVFALTVCFFSLVLLVLRGILIWLLWRHRLRPELARTQRMTRSLGVNLTVPQFVWPRLSLAGFAVHAGIVLALGTLAYVFRDWIVNALIGGFIGLFLIVLGAPAQLIAMVFNFFYAGTPFELAKMWAALLSSFGDTAKLLVPIGVFLFARAIWRFGRRLNLRHRNEIILKDKPPVLLLRSFTDDVAGIPPNMLIPRWIRRRKRLEETIGEQLTGAGPFVAIGRPGEQLPQLGASRLYVGDSEWQAVVQSYIAQAELIIVIAGKTHWVQWELANVIRQDRLAGLLIVFPRITEADRNERWQNLKPAFSETSWSAAMERVDIAGALAVFITVHRGIVVIKSRKANESDYETALRVATYLMRQKPATG